MNPVPVDPQRASEHPDWRAARFGRAAGTYHEATPVQAAMAERLASGLPDGFRPASVLELGCGTGHLTRALLNRFPRAEILATDLSEAMLSRSRDGWDLSARPRWRILDGRTPVLPGQRFDLVTSSAMVQWFPSLLAHLRACRDLVGEGGHLAVSGFADDHFPELERILRREPFGYPPGPGHSEAAVSAALADAGWRTLGLETAEIPWDYPSAAAFLDHLRASGANRPPPPGKRMSRSGLRLLLESLQEEARGPSGVRITWRPWFLVAVAA